MTAYPTTLTASPWQKATFQSHDGTRLHYRFRTPAVPGTEGVVLLHRGHEHAGRMIETGDALAETDRWIFALDNRGHGESPGQPGEAVSFSQLRHDLDAFIRHLEESHRLSPPQLTIVAHSVNAVVASGWVLDHAPDLRGLVLVAPAFSIRLYLPGAIPALGLLTKLNPEARVRSYVNARLLTHDTQQVADYREDARIHQEIPAHMLLEFHREARRIVANADGIRIPTMVLSAGRDWVVRTQPQKQFFHQLGSARRRWQCYPEAYHGLLHEKGRSEVFDDIRAFLNDLPAAPEREKGERIPHTRWWSQYRHEKVTRQPTWWRRIGFALQRGLMQTVGRLSDGIRLGWEAGFDSGRALDYIYRNEPSGITPLGKAMDRAYLAAPGWHGIRQRRILMHETLDEAVRDLQCPGRLLHVTDIAAGPGRYLLETLGRPTPDVIQLHLHDYQTANLEAGRQLAEQLGVGNASFTWADAFDPEVMGRAGYQADLAIVSGLYELFPDNDDIRRSLSGLTRLVRPGGLLIYTCQPWHPQLEFIARVLRNREGNPWVMRCRRQNELDDLVRAAGFTKVRTRADDHGIFTVSLARRQNPIA